MFSDELLRYLLAQSNVSINVKDHLGHTALFIAVQNKNYEAAKMLIESGAEVRGNIKTVKALYFKLPSETMSKFYSFISILF